ncbi:MULTISPECIES: SRPBCC family protein [Pseudomonas]|uniref:SRPBCC family protein n=1 Tax=Pseudomonas TaxID=286 RepID=UPI000B35C5D8|nr:MULTISPECIES: SRPBCC family protein [Pseudomonas]PMY65051.1 polyketide cyclase [Pseudomonas sp. FW305-25]PMY69683.1 polyketide cyclase [Pseudomonas sp. FW126-L8]PNA76854.1 polyketide cyclase [Pseudomonas sp. FW305-76]
MPVLERTTFITGRSPAQVLDFCLEGANFPKIFPERISPLRGVDINDLRISVGRQFSFRHWMWSVIPVTWTVVIREVSDRHFVDEMLKGPLRAFSHEHRVEACDGGTLYTDRVTYRALGGAPVEWLVVNAYMARIFAARHRTMLRLLG